MTKKPGPSKRHYFHTTITLPAPLYEKVRALALSRAVPHTQIYREAVEAYLRDLTHDRDSPRSPEDPFGKVAGNKS